VTALTPEQAGARLAGLVGGPAGHTVAFGQVHVDVPAAAWLPAARHARDDAQLGCRYFDWLSGVDELDEGFAVVAHLYSVEHRHHLLLRTRVPRAEPVLASLAGVYAGAAWHERETFEMFGVVFEGHPDLKPLLLPDGFEGHPLRKDFVLAARVIKAWPGAKEPGESDHGAPSRRRVRPPGVPDPAEWGPAAGAPAAGPAGGGASGGGASGGGASGGGTAEAGAAGGGAAGGAAQAPGARGAAGRPERRGRGGPRQEEGGDA
jgi:NADH-quinone oxidoreductase subunit C